MSTGSSIPRFVAPIAAPIESLPQTLPALLGQPESASKTQLFLELSRA
jgi:hypothetical protein